MVKIKICGITNYRDAVLAVDLGAHALGFNFYRPSPRYILPADAAAISRKLPPFVHTVGVFVNEAQEEVVELARDLRLSFVQLHGDETPDYVAGLKGPGVIKTIRVGNRSDLRAIGSFRFDALLLDSRDDRLFGGTGRSFEWDLARRAKKYGPVILSGGLSPDNVSDAIRTAQPDAVDVCSGVEKRPGIKDAARLKAFVLRVLETDISYGSWRSALGPGWQISGGAVRGGRRQTAFKKR
ncbi:MAG: phosphoribosylanthranilate isomerase [Acidobacteria bacterium]|nr:phosphoribosylanthranilate isomerase [Acidobacteriota bacterium]